MKLTKKSKVALITIGLTVAWGGIFYGSFNLVKNHYDESINEIKAQNEAFYQELSKSTDERIDKISDTIDSMNDKVGDLSGDLDQLNNEIDGLSEALESVNLTLADTDVVQLQIGDRLSDLDNQLKALKESLDILMEAPSEVD